MDYAEKLQIFNEWRPKIEKDSVCVFKSMEFIPQALTELWIIIDSGRFNPNYIRAAVRTGVFAFQNARTTSRQQWFNKKKAQGEEEKVVFVEDPHEGVDSSYEDKCLDSRFILDEIQGVCTKREKEAIETYVQCGGVLADCVGVNGFKSRTAIGNRICAVIDKMKNKL